MAADPAGVLVFVVPSVHIFASVDSVADKVHIAIVADLLVADDPA